MVRNGGSPRFGGVLSDSTIERFLDDKTLTIVPRPKPDFIKGASVDLRLNNVFLLPIRVKAPFIDPLFPISTESYLQTIAVPFGDKFIVHPGEFILASTYEYLEIPTTLLGRIEGRSSMARLGVVVHATAGKIDPGFRGRLIFELSNIGSVPIALYPLMRIACVEFYTILGKVSRPYAGKYLAQPSTEGTKIFEDEDLSKIAELKQKSDRARNEALNKIWGEDRATKLWPHSELTTVSKNPETVRPGKKDSS